jgi:hypothetical protein
MVKFVVTRRMELEANNLIENTDTSIADIASELGWPLSVLREHYELCYTSEFRAARKTRCYRQSKLGDKNPMLGKRGDRHPCYIGEVSDGKGYLMIIKPDWYTGRKGCKHVFVHHIVMCQALGLTEIPRGMIVHHIDHNPTNNNLSNLQMMTPSAHSRLHSLERATTIRKE